MQYYGFCRLIDILIRFCRLWRKIMEKKSDRRSLKTQKAIKKALVSQLRTKAITEITIKDLTTEADIHRATFYLHYEDIFDAYKDLKNDLMLEFTNIMDNKEIVTYSDFYDAMLDVVYEHKDICNIILRNSQLNDFTKQIAEYLIDSCYVTWKQEESLNVISFEMECFAHYRVYGILAIVEHWLHKDNQLSLSDLKQLVAKLDETIDSFMLKEP